MKNLVLFIIAVGIASSAICSCRSAKETAVSHDSFMAEADSCSSISSDSVALATEVSENSASVSIDSVAIIPEVIPGHDTGGFKAPVVMLYGVSLRSDFSRRLDTWNFHSDRHDIGVSASSKTESQSKSEAPEPKPASIYMILLLVAIILILIVIGSRFKKY